MAPKKKTKKPAVTEKRKTRTPLKNVSNVSNAVATPRVEKHPAKRSLAISRRSSTINSTGLIHRKNMNPRFSKAIHSELKKYVWTPFRVGVLVNFKSTEQYLKRYQRFIRAGLGGSNFSVAIEKMHSLEGESEGVPCFRINVKKPELGNRTVAESWLVGLTSSIEDRLTDDEVHIPLLLARGNKTVFERLNSLLEVLFSTTVHQMSFRLKRTVGLCLHAHEMAKNLTLLYTYGKSKTQITLPSECVSQILHETRNDTRLTSNAIADDSTFFQKVQTKIKQVFGIDTVVLNLKAVKCPDFMVDIDGKISMKSYEAFEAITTDLIDIAETRINCALDFA